MDDDTQLVQDAQNGNSTSFETLYKNHFRLLFGFIYKKTGSRQDSEDIVSIVWTSVVENLNNFKGESTFKNWLFGIAKYKIIDYYREKYKIEKLPLVEEIYALENEDTDESIDQDKINIINKILEKMPDNYKKVLELRFLKGYTTTEIAKELGMTVSNIKVIQHRALKKAAIR